MGKVQATSKTINLRHAIADFFSWWSRGLQACVPERIAEIYRIEPFQLVLEASGDQWQVWRPYFSLFAGRANRKMLHDGDLQSATDIVAKHASRWGRLASIIVHLPESQCLIRNKVVPRTAGRHAGDILLLDLERLTPFKRADVFTGWYQSEGQGNWGNDFVARQIVIRRALIAPILDRLRSIPIRVQAIGIRDDKGTLLPVRIPIDKNDLNVTSGFNRVLLMLAALLCVTACTTSYFAVARQHAAITRLEAEAGTLRRSVIEARKRIEESHGRYARVLQHRLRKVDATPVLAVWEEVTKRLPHSAWVTSFRLEGGQLHLEGFASSAAELIDHFENSSLFSNVSFTSPVVADRQKNKERFRIQLGLASSSKRTAGRLNQSTGELR